MRYLTLLLILLAQSVWASPDYAREKKWADEIVPGVVVGNPHYLQARGHQFLTLFTEAPQARAGLVIVHGIGVHPDHGLIGVLRSRLADEGYSTLSVQMPILAAEADAANYVPHFAEAGERLAAAVKYLQDKNYKKIAIISHSLGSRMTLEYFRQHKNSPAGAWVAIGMGAENYGGIDLPVYDLYGSKDLPAVVKNAGTRAASLKNGRSMQTAAPNMDHFFTGYDEDLVNYVKTYLDKTL